MSWYHYFNGMSFNELIEQFNSPNHRNDIDFFDTCAVEIANHGTLGIGFLIGYLHKAPARKVASIMFGLGELSGADEKTRSIAYDVLMKYLHSPDKLIPMRVIDSFAHLKYTEAKEHILPLKESPSPYIKGGVIRYMSELFPEEARPIIREYLTDPHFIVRECAIDAIDDYALVDLMPLVYPFLKDPHPHVRQAATTAVANFEDQ